MARSRSGRGARTAAGLGAVGVGGMLTPSAYWARVQRREEVRAMILLAGMLLLIVLLLWSSE